MGWPIPRACAEACLLGEPSQQPMCPQDWHMRRCTHQAPLARHSSQPAMLSGSAVNWMLSRCEQRAVPVREPAAAPRRRRNESMLITGWRVGRRSRSLRSGCERRRRRTRCRNAWADSFGGFVCQASSDVSPGRVRRSPWSIPGWRYRGQSRTDERMRTA